MSDRLCEILSSSGKVDVTQLKTARETQDKVGGNLGVILVKLRYLTEQQLVDVLAEAMKLEKLQLQDLIVAPAVSALMDVEVLEQHMVLPLQRSEKELTVATADPLDGKAEDEIKLLTGLSPKFSIATRTDIQKAIDYYCHSKPCEVLEQAEQGKRKLKSVTEKGFIRSSAAAETPDSSVPPLLRALIELMIEKKLITREELAERTASNK